VRFGIFISDLTGPLVTLDQVAATARDAEAAGFASGWVPHIPWSHDALTALAIAGAATSTIELGTGVVPTYSRHPLGMAQQALSTQAACGGRLALGIGPSHQSVIEGMYGLSYDKPARHTREYVEVLRSAFAGTGVCSYQGEVFHVQAMFKVPEAQPVPILVAALAPLMLKLAGELTDGTLLWMADVRAVGEYVVPRITKAAADAGRPAPRVLGGLPIALADPDAARERAAKVFAAYGNIPTYRRMLDRGDATDPADVVLAGDEAAIEQRLRAYADAGLTEVVCVPFGVGDGEAERAASTTRTTELLADLHRRW
jgi:F420-dependent oxidoreductase-like protein